MSDQCWIGREEIFLLSLFRPQTREELFEISIRDWNDRGMGGFAGAGAEDQLCELGPSYRTGTGR